LISGIRRGVKSSFLVIFLVITLQVLVTDLFSGEGVKLGVVKVSPSLDLGFGYNSNVYLSTQANAPSDMFLDSTVALGVALPFYTHSFSLNLDVSILRFINETKQNNVSVSPSAQMEMNFTGGLGLIISDDFKYTKEPIFGNYVNAVERTPRYKNVLIPKIRYNIPSGIISTFVGLKWNLDMFPTMVNYDSDQYEMFFNVLYKFLPKTSAYINGSGFYVKRDSPAYNDTTNFKGMFGLKGLITPKLSTDLGLGWYYGGSGGAANDPIVKISVNEKFSKLMNLTLQYDRIVQPAITSDFYLVNKVSFTLWRSLTPIFETSFVGSWWEVDYSPSGQVDDNFTAGVNFAFVPVVATWFKTSLGYNFSMRKSNKANYNYNDHIVKLNFQFSL